MRTLLAPVGGTLALHLLLVLVVSRAPDSRSAKRIVPLVVHEAPPKPRRADLKPPPPDPSPPRHSARLAPKRVAQPSAPAPEAPPAPPQGFSVDNKSTVTESSVAVATKEGGGNAFADPGSGLPPGDRVSVRPPPLPARFVPAEWITDPRDRSPPYPAAALRSEIEGQVLLRVCVGPNGAVDSVQVVRGIGFGCDEAAASWARQRWRFRAARRGDTPVATCLLQPMRFQLQR
jgi:protein TonB